MRFLSIVILLCADGLLVQHLEEETRRYKRFKILSSIIELKSHLKLLLQGPEDITEKAEVTFYKLLDKNTLFYREELPRKIIERYPILLFCRLGYLGGWSRVSI